MSWWKVDAGLPGGREGERDGVIEAPTEETARERYLAQRPEGWVIFSIEPGDAPQPYVPPEPEPDEQIEQIAQEE